MARATKTLTTSWQLLSAKKATFHVQKTKGFSIFFNETASDTNMISKIMKQGDQAFQNEIKDTYAKVNTQNVDAEIVVIEEGS